GAGPGVRGAGQRGVSPAAGRSGRPRAAAPGRPQDGGVHRRGDRRRAGAGAPDGAAPAAADPADLGAGGQAVSEASPPGRTTAELASARQVDEACYRFEMAWKAGQRPRIEEFAAGVEEAVRPALLAELVALEIDYRLLAGEQPGPEEYRARFPSLDLSRMARDAGAATGRPASVDKAVTRQG